MRRDLVQQVLDAASAELFEDVTYTPVNGQPATVTRAIFGVEIADDRFDSFGVQVRIGTLVTRALKSKFPELAKGDRIDDGVVAYVVQDFQPIGDGRFEVLISLKAA